MEAGDAGNLQSGFVLAAIIFAFFFVDRLGGADQLARRIFQVVLAALITFTIFAGTTAFIRPPDVTQVEDLQSGASGESGDEQQQQAQIDYLKDLSRRNTGVTAIHAGLGAVAAIVGLALMRRWSAIPLGVLLAGLFLVLFGGGTGGSDETLNPLSLLYSAFGASAGDQFGVADQGPDIARFVVMLASTAALVAYGLYRWELSREQADGGPIIGQPRTSA